MPHADLRRHLLFQDMLESGVRFAQQAAPGRRKIMASKTNGRNAMGNRNVSFFAKNGKKEVFLLAGCFAIAFRESLVYCIMVALALK